MLIVVFVGLRLGHLSADPPRQYPTGLSARELLWEGPAKAHEARRYGLSGTFSTNSADEYNIWSTQSPVYVWPLSAFFRVFGVGYAQLRIFGVLAGAAGLAALYMIGRRHSHGAVATFACAFYALSFYDIHLTRAGLLEPYLNTILILTFLAAIRALDGLPWLIACAFGFVAAVLTKQTALVALPILAGIGVLAVVAARRRHVPRWQYAVVVAVGLLLALALFWYVRRPEYWRTVEWNFWHAAAGVEAHRELSFGVLSFMDVLHRVADPRRWPQTYLFVVPVAVFALIQLGRTILSGLRRHSVDRVDALASVWLVFALLSLQLTPLVRARFSIIVLPPTALLAASFVSSRSRFAAWSVLRAAPLAAAVLVVLMTDLRWHWEWWREPTHDLQTASVKLSRELDERSVVVGTKAPALVFDTAAETFYVKRGFNNSATALSRLGITHLLLPRGHSPGRFARTFPTEYRTKERRLATTVGGTSYVLYRLR